VILSRLLHIRWTDEGETSLSPKAVRDTEVNFCGEDEARAKESSVRARPLICAPFEDGGRRKQKFERRDTA